MGECTLESCDSEKDLGVMTGKECDAVAKRAKVILGHISRGTGGRR